MVTDRAPDGLPVLSRGKHRSPRKGACFMEMASVLANEPWSDHPSCTHPLLGGLARLVNDHTSDQNRGKLAVLIPSVVGLRGGGLAWVVQVTSAVALRAIPDVPEHSQRALAVGLIRCDELAASLGLVAHADAVDQALDRAPDAVAWARRFAAGSKVPATQFVKRGAPSVMRCAVLGSVASVTTDVDAQLRDLLQVGIATAERLGPQAEPGSSAVSRDRPVRVGPRRR
jgi:hypothetical protein